MNSTRRTFLGLTGAAALWPRAKVSARTSRAQAEEGTPLEGEEYWQMVRRQFSFSEDRVPLNSANLCPSPRVVTERLVELTHDIDRDCSFQNYNTREHVDRTVAAVKELREKIV